MKFRWYQAGMMILVTLTVTVFYAGRYAYPDGPGDVRNSKHNLAATGGQAIRARTVNEVCAFCHTPHRSLTAGPLWNHSLSTRASYGLYSSPTLLSPQPAGNKPDGDSLLCLSCHDGDRPVGAVQNLGGLTTTISMTGPRLSAGGQLTGAASFGSDLSGHHPISIEINQCLVNDKTTDPVKGCPSASVDWKIKIPGAAYMRPTTNRYGNPCALGNTGKGVQCSSCHDAHSSNPMFLRIGGSGSWSSVNYNDSLCLVCHVAC